MVVDIAGDSLPEVIAFLERTPETSLFLLLLARLFKDARETHGMNRIFLFTGEENVPARTLYESMGFERFGHFGLFFGEPLP